MRIGVDTGGTFTDCVVLAGSRVKILKVFSGTDPARSVVEASYRLSEAGQGKLPTLIHGTTVGTNSLLERRGARVALITTAGFEDLIEIGRQNRQQLYNLDLQRDPPLVPRRLRLGTKERTAADGKIVLELTRSELLRLQKRVQDLGVDSLAICFLFSFANPAHERRVARALRRLGLPVSVSHEILPEFREYERLSTVVTNAYLAPLLGRYLGRLGREAKRQFAVGKPSEPQREPESGPRIFVMQSSGGIMSARRAAQEPVRTILSGPAGGVVAARWLADLVGIRQAISFDMGGTSTDVCLLDGSPRVTHETTLGDLPVAVPVLDVHSVGAGGGSLARMDAGGALRVGPESAGSVPGPVCCRRGGTRPTVTDAHLLLGRLDADQFLGGEFRLDLEAAQRSFTQFLRPPNKVPTGKQTGLETSFDLARGIVAVASAGMEKALRVISVERGRDPREFSLVCFGGAGGLHAADLARSLRLKQVIVPRNPGAFSALGILLSDVVKDVSQSVLVPIPSGKATRAAENLCRRLERRFVRLEQEARTELREDGLTGEPSRIERRLDVRYAGQSYELSIPFVPRFGDRFHGEHEKTYGYADPIRPLEVVNLRLRLVIPTPKLRLQPERVTKSNGLSTAVVKRKSVWFGRRRHPTLLYDRDRLYAGAHWLGPAVVVEYSSTTFVPPDFSCRVDEYLNLVLERHAS